MRWFVREGRIAPEVPRVDLVKEPESRYAGRRSDPPPRGIDDQGGDDWEKDLIRAIRSKGLLWRTETTYRQWATRFAKFLIPRSPYAASEKEIAAFLSHLAVTGRVSSATQRQALNALVFLIQVGLRRKVGEIEFRRAESRRRVPTVLTKGECQRVFDQLKGTSRLMAELMYGAGLRLMELLRLRVHHLDLERNQLKIIAGKGDKDRLTVLPARLAPTLRGNRSSSIWELVHGDVSEAVWRSPRILWMEGAEVSGIGVAAGEKRVPRSFTSDSERSGKPRNAFRVPLR